MNSKNLLLLIPIFFIAWDPTNPPTGVTGAPPNEKTCSTALGCHTGGTYNGVVELTGVPDTIELSKTYTLRLKVKASSAKRSGFEITALNQANTAAGTFSTGVGVGIKSSGGRNYARQSAVKNFVGDTAVWTFPWKAPDVVSDSIKFYFVGMCANGTGNNSGDNAVAGVKKVVFKQTTSSSEEQLNSISIYPNPAKEYFIIDGLDKQSSFKIFSSQGQMVKSIDIMYGNKIDISELNSGLYFVKIKDQKNDGNSTIIKLYKQ